MNFIKYLPLFIILSGCSFFHDQKNITINQKCEARASIGAIVVASPKDTIQKIFSKKADYLASGFNFPVGKPNADGYYNAQKFGENNHLGDDWNAVTGGNSDLGDPIYSIANGYVNFAKDINGGWGKVIRVYHHTKNGETIESLYAHCQEILVHTGQYVKKGEKIATIGNADGQYLAHLHFEIRNDINLPIGQGYSLDTNGYLDPTKFIKEHRK